MTSRVGDDVSDFSVILPIGRIAFRRIHVQGTLGSRFPVVRTELRNKSHRNQRLRPRSVHNALRLRHQRLHLLCQVLLCPLGLVGNGILCMGTPRYRYS